MEALSPCGPGLGAPWDQRRTVCSGSGLGRPSSQRAQGEAEEEEGTTSGLSLCSRGNSRVDDEWGMNRIPFRPVMGNSGSSVTQ